MSEVEKIEHVSDDEIEPVNYTAPKQMTIEEIVAKDQEDESLRKYKEQLLGSAQAETIVFGLYNIFVIITIERDEMTLSVMRIQICVCLF